MATFASSTWQDLGTPGPGLSCVWGARAQVINDVETAFVVDNNGYLWAYGLNLGWCYLGRPHLTPLGLGAGTVDRGDSCHVLVLDEKDDHLRDCVVTGLWANNSPTFGSCTWADKGRPKQDVLTDPFGTETVGDVSHSFFIGCHGGIFRHWENWATGERNWEYETGLAAQEGEPLTSLSPYGGGAIGTCVTDDNVHAIFTIGDGVWSRSGDGSNINSWLHTHDLGTGPGDAFVGSGEDFGASSIGGNAARFLRNGVPSALMVVGYVGPFESAPGSDRIWVHWRDPVGVEVWWGGWKWADITPPLPLFQWTGIVQSIVIGGTSLWVLAKLTSFADAPYLHPDASRWWVSRWEVPGSSTSDEPFAAGPNTGWGVDGLPEDAPPVDATGIQQVGALATGESPVFYVLGNGHLYRNAVRERYEGERLNRGTGRDF